MCMTTGGSRPLLVQMHSELPILTPLIGPGLRNHPQDSPSAGVRQDLCVSDRSASPVPGRRRPPGRSSCTGPALPEGQRCPMLSNDCESELVRRRLPGKLLRIQQYRHLQMQVMTPYECHRGSGISGSLMSYPAAGTGRKHCTDAFFRTTSELRQRDIRTQPRCVGADRGIASTFAAASCAHPAVAVSAVTPSRSQTAPWRSPRSLSVRTNSN